MLLTILAMIAASLNQRHWLKPGKHTLPTPDVLYLTGAFGTEASNLQAYPTTWDIEEKVSVAYFARRGPRCNDLYCLINLARRLCA